MEEPAELFYDYY